MKEILIPISPGELLDKVSILKIKKTKMTDPDKLKNVSYELIRLQGVIVATDLDWPSVIETEALLLNINIKLWEVEDTLRVLEKQQNFDAAFITLARKVYKLNDQRSHLKRHINTLLGSTLVEEKSYEECK